MEIRQRTSLIKNQIIIKIIKMTSNQKRTSEKRKEQLNNAQKAYKKRKLDYEEKLHEQILKIESFSEKLNQLEKKIEQGFRKIQGSMEKGIQEIKKFSNPEKEKNEKKKELKKKEQEFKEKREKRI